MADTEKENPGDTVIFSSKTDSYTELLTSDRGCSWGTNSVLCQQELCKLTILQTLGLPHLKQNPNKTLVIPLCWHLQDFVVVLEAVTQISYEILHISQFL